MKARGNKLKYLNKNIRQCIICGLDFKLKTANQITCSDKCRFKRESNINRIKYNLKKPVQVIKSINIKAAKIDRKEIEMDRKRERALKMSPDIDKLTPVIIDKRTVIYIKSWQNPEEVRNNFMLRYKY